MKRTDLFGIPVVISDVIPPDTLLVGNAEYDFVRDKLVNVRGVRVINLAPASSSFQPKTKQDQSL
jgi:hypothetical protein